MDSGERATPYPSPPRSALTARPHRVDTVNMYSKHKFEDVPIVDPATPWQPGESFS
jgi:hypothetical protein